jgi:ArsR family transcriptional regulator
MTILHTEPTNRFAPADVGTWPSEPKTKAASELRHLPDPTAKRLVGLFRLLADETRLRILCFLQQRRELNVRTLCHLLDQSQPAVSHHLAMLRMDGIVEMRRDGKHNFYRITPKRFEELLAALSAVSSGVGCGHRPGQERTPL